jgi:hypothetical protein
MKISSLFAASLIALSIGCFNKEEGDVKVTLEDKIGGENGKEIQFAIFGVAENAGQTSMIVIASDDADLCGEIGDNAGAFIADVQAGEEPGRFVLTTVLVDGALTAGERFDGDKQNDQVVDPQFLVGNGAKLEAGGADKDKEATLFVDFFDGQNFEGSIEANLNLDLNGNIFTGKDLNDPLTVEIKASTECAALSDFAAAQF